MLLDIHGERLDLMNQCNVEHFVLVSPLDLSFLSVFTGQLSLEQSDMNPISQIQDSTSNPYSPVDDDIVLRITLTVVPDFPWSTRPSQKVRSRGSGKKGK